MPIYEDKLISPLAVRFTQDRIKETFRDGREVDLAITQITTRPGVGDYDIILHAPFPDIEVVYWRSKKRVSRRGANAKGRSWAEPEFDGWFSFDNRRLYCLQRVAADLWPRRVAAVVQALYADSGDMRRKYDSTTLGTAVCIGRCRETPIGYWDWREEVDAEGSPAERSAERIISADDAKDSVDDLLSAPAAPNAASLMVALKEGALVGDAKRDGELSDGSGSEISTQLPEDHKAEKYLAGIAAN